VASSKVLLVDHTKFERRAMFRLCPLDEFDHVVVDSKTPADVVEEIRKLDVDVTVAHRIH
jgi:DeoR/GlpR family transcriptional regulator of sugar metabolism